MEKVAEPRLQGVLPVVPTTVTKTRKDQPYLPHAVVFCRFPAGGVAPGRANKAFDTY